MIVHRSNMQKLIETKPWKQIINKDIKGVYNHVFGIHTNSGIVRKP